MYHYSSLLSQLNEAEKFIRLIKGELQTEWDPSSHWVKMLWKK